MTNSDQLIFLDEFPPGDRRGAPRPTQPAWRILVVDDDSDVHETTRLALDRIEILGRPVELLHAMSAAEGLAVLAREQGIAAILLDVVMETADAGLAMIAVIRDTLNLRNVRIILRTGQPGQAPEMDTITRYDIDDYKTKTELTRSKLFTTLTTALRSYDRLRQLDASRNGLEKIITASNQFIAHQGLRHFAEGVITQISGLLGVDPDGVVCAAFDRDDPNGGKVVAAAGRHSGLIRRKLDEIEEMPIREALARCMRERKSHFAETYIALCFEVDDRRVMAAFINSSASIRELDRQLIEIFSLNISLCADNILLVEDLRKLAFQDQLTGLPNRAGFIDRLDFELSAGHRDTTSLALVDIDNFSEINDILGHDHGDHLLQAVARRLTDTLATCMVARVAPDVFGVLGDTDALLPLMNGRVFRTPFAIDRLLQPVTASIGISHLRDIAEHGPAGMMDAYSALKHAKTRGNGEIAYFQPDRAAETRERIRLLNDMRLALGQNALYPVYQPQIDLKTGAVTGVEALMRWRSPDGTVIPPDRFIPIAEQSGLIVPMGQWMLRTALDDLKTLHNRGHATFRMAVNISAIQLQQQDLADLIEAELALRDINPHFLELEITESAAVIGMERVAIILRDLRRRGVRIAIDDFGTGFSSLSYIDRLPADHLKIDRAFVATLDREGGEGHVAAMIALLGRQLGMRIIAEGVETETQANILRQMNCDEAQGYMYARPMPMEELVTWLAARQA